VIESSSSAHVQPALRPSTRTDSTESPAKSRLKRDSACIARANIVIRPSTVCCAAAVG
jgi:hypothetical protein